MKLAKDEDKKGDQSFLKGLVIRAVSWLSRTPEDVENLSSPATKYIGLSICLMLLGSGLSLFIITGKEELNRWDKPAPELLLPKSGWKVLYEDGQIVCGDDARGSGCIADPSSDTLWRSGHTRADKDHSVLVRERKGKKLWLGYDIPPGQLAVAYEQDANKVILGWIGAGYLVWVNGVLRGKGHDDRVPVHVSLDYYEMKHKNGVKVVLEVDYDTEALFPVGMNNGEESLASSKSTSYLLLRKSLTGETVPMMSAVMNLMIALLFVFFWLTSPIKYEYLWLSIFCFAQFMAQVSSIKFVYSTLGYSTIWNIVAINYFFEAAFGLLLALAFARVRTIIYKYMVPIALVAPLLMTVFAKDVETMGAISNVLVTYGIPGAYGIGTVIVVLQLYYLLTTTPKQKLKERKRIMLLFVIGMSVMASGAYLKSSGVFSAEKLQLTYRYIHGTLICFLSFIVLMDYKRQAEVVRRFKTSRFHASGRVGEWINGALLQVDLKGSTTLAEMLKQQTGNDEVYGLFVRKWYDDFTAQATKFGGEILNEAGDAISIFFDDQHDRSALPYILAALEQMQGTHPDLMTAFGLCEPLFLRGSIVYGSIQPCWKGQGANSRPGWDGKIFIDSARVMELERKVDGNDSASVIIVETKNLKSLGSGHEHWDLLITDTVLEDKDKAQRRVSAIKLATPLKSLKNSA